MSGQNQQGTGKHGHKDTEEPYPHHGKSASHAQGGSGESGSRSEGSDSRGEEQSLKEREYRDSEGNVHHHTRTYEEQHGKK